jgi:rod shape-determining protein MreD
MHLFLQNTVRFILLVLFQVLVLNNIEFLGYVNPYLYILFIITLPVKLPKWIAILIAFATGLLIDTFSNTHGMHAFAAVLIAFLRTGIIELFITIEEGNNPTPTFYTFGLNAYIKYVVLMVLIYHMAFFMLEAFSLAHIWLLLTKIVLSSVVTFIMIMGFQTIKSK